MQLTLPSFGATFFFMDKENMEMFFLNREDFNYLLYNGQFQEETRQQHTKLPCKKPAHSWFTG